MADGLMPMTAFVFLYVLLIRMMYKLLVAAAAWLPKVLNKVGVQEKSLLQEANGLKTEQRSINAQDEFAKYVRLQRRIDKLSEERLTQAQSRNKRIAAQQRVLKIVVMLCLLVVHISVIAANRKEPVIILPKQWFYPLQNVLAFPTGIAGAIGIPFWMITCNRIVGTFII